VAATGQTAEEEFSSEHLISFPVHGYLRDEIQQAAVRIIDFLLRAQG
jgi:hypothetical protein